LFGVKEEVPVEDDTGSEAENEDAEEKMHCRLEGVHHLKDKAQPAKENEKLIT
jgi:hypothetical protein